MESILIAIVVYLLGVIVALVVLAWVNSDPYEGEVMNEGWAALSWLTIAFILIVVVGFFVTRPFNWLYERLKGFFER